MGIERVFPHQAPTPRGPYSPAVRAGDFIYVSGQGPIDTVTDKLSLGDIQHETDLVLGNIRRILESCGATMADVVKCSVFLRDIGDFAEMNVGLRYILHREQAGPDHGASDSAASGDAD